ncbi:MAG: NAD-dependent protein deacylase [Wenzhouxiangella sp.]|nr:NAD-dependent protein deacylase [Wenzhouxiangella sp.]
MAPPATALPDDLVQTLGQAKRVVALTGAGVSAESGIPTFREAQRGLWAQFDPMALASPEGFAADPARVWDWYQWRRELIGNSLPNPGHHALAELAGMVDRFCLITQNVDGFHQLAGSTNVLELHGNITRTICSRTRKIVDPDWLARHAGQHPPPSPHHPDGLCRPDVVWFGEALDERVLSQAMQAASQADLMIVAGTAGAVYPAAGLPALAAEHGARTIDINPEATAISRLADWHLSGPSAHWLPRLAAALADQNGSSP